MTDPTRSAELYHAAHERMAAAVRDLSAEDLDRQVPACPQWSVQDLIAHLTVVTPDGTYSAGSDGSPVATGRTTSYELFRAIFGRRSAAQIMKWDWDDPQHAKLWSTALARLPQTSVSLND